MNKKCDCKVTGDGCRHCQPQTYIDWLEAELCLEREKIGCLKRAYLFADHAATWEGMATNPGVSRSQRRRRERAAWKLQEKAAELYDKAEEL